MIKQEEYSYRREQLFKKMNDGSMLVLFSGEKKKLSHDRYYPFEVNRNFYYLTGINEPSCVLLAVKSLGEVKEYLFILPYEEAKAKFYSDRMSMEQASAISGIRNVLLSTALTPRINGILDPSCKTHGDVSYCYFDLEEGQKTVKGYRIDEFAHSIELSYNVEIIDCHDIICSHRIVKSEAEIEEIDSAIHTTSLALASAMGMVRPGIFEYEIANSFIHVANDISACQGMTIDPCFASGANTLVQDCRYGPKRLGGEEILVFKGGARSDLYCSLVSRTIPVSHRFEGEYRKAYQALLDAQKAALNFLKPGVSFNDISSIVQQYLTTECLLKKIAESKDEIASSFYAPSCSYIGLDVIDPASGSGLLEEGNILYLELRLYMEKAGYCMKLGDTVRIKTYGAECLSGGIIKEIRDIESFYSGR